MTNPKSKRIEEVREEIKETKIDLMKTKSWKAYWTEHVFNTKEYLDELENELEELLEGGEDD